MDAAHESAGSRHTDLLTDYGPERQLERIQAAGYADPRSKAKQRVFAEAALDRARVRIQIEKIANSPHELIIRGAIHQQCPLARRERNRDAASAVRGFIHALHTGNRACPQKPQKAGPIERGLKRQGDH